MAEIFVALIYLFKFHKILAWRYKTRAGEIDLICKRGKRILFVEVKARRSNIDDRFFGPNQKSRIKSAASLFMQRNSKYQNYDYRFDLVVVRPWRFPEFYKNAW
jgi:putative endonuclease